MEEEIKQICAKYFDLDLQNAFERDQKRANANPQEAFGTTHCINLKKNYRQAENEIIKIVPKYQNPADGLKRLGLNRDLSGDYIEKLAKKYDYTNLVDGDDGHVYKVHCYKTGSSKSDTLELKFTLSAVNNGKVAQIDPNWQKAHEKGK